MKKLLFLFVSLALSVPIQAQNNCLECQEMERILTDTFVNKFYVNYKQFYDGDFHSSYITGHYSVQELKELVNSYMIPRISSIVGYFEKLDEGELQHFYIKDVEDIYKQSPFDGSLILKRPWDCNYFNTRCTIGMIFEKSGYRYGVLITIMRDFDFQGTVIDINIGRVEI